MNHDELAALDADPVYQINRWQHAADWWNGRILFTVKDETKAAYAEKQVRIWSKKLDAR